MYDDERCEILTLSIRYEGLDPLDAWWEEFIGQVISFCLRYENCPYKVDVSLLFANDLLIKEINKDYRGINEVTDVISFPSISFDRPSNFKLLEVNSELNFNPDTGKLLLGDIVISFERAQSQAQEYGHSLKREIAFLVTHSMFHLMGYKHDTDSERKIMEDKQEDILNQLGIYR